MGLPPFQAFLDAHRHEVHRFLVAAVGGDDADDCFQETFIAALRGYRRLPADSNLRAWVLTIAHRKAIDAHRARRRRPAPVDELPDTGADPAPDHDEALWAAVRRLAPRQRAAVLHRFVNDLPYRAIGDVMGCTEQAARRSVHDGLARLREAWRP
ncbi:MAG: sigma-70 family RNA polymerase sigma factor [Actinomycetota bacterium]|nr:sigma-70 family RNA polymerase sigma factor [Actinomycetota bacterium]